MPSFFRCLFYLKTMKASSKDALIADSLCYDEPTVKVDSVKECVLLFYIYCIHIRLRISHTSGFGLLQPYKTFAGWL